ncbi:MAG: LytTR family DNA-binding domain-containing protein [Gemmatimonas sp.]
MSKAPRLRAVIVDDEELARERLRCFLLDEADIEIIGEASSGSAAVRLIADKRPDIVFLDVQMPGLDGFGVLRSIAQSYAPAIVFVTAHDAYAIRAFEVQAVDYLLKPVTRLRLHNATERAAARVRTNASEGKTRSENERAIAAVLASVPLSDSGPRIPIRRDGRTDFVSIAAINWVEAHGDYLTLHTTQQTFELRQTLTELVEVLPSDEFLRVHRSYVVRIARVASIRSVLRGGYELTLADSATVPAGRTYRDVVRDTFKSA